MSQKKEKKSAFQAFQDVMSMSNAYWRSRCLFVVTELGVADVIHQYGPSTASFIAQKTSTHPQSLFRVMRLLTVHGVFDADRESVDMETRFSLNDTSQVLRSDHLMSARSMIRLEAGWVHYTVWGGLLDTVRTGEKSVPKTLGTSDYWEYMNQHPEHAERFNTAMNTMSAPEAHKLAEYMMRAAQEENDNNNNNNINNNVGIESLRKVMMNIKTDSKNNDGFICDVGGGTGCILKEVLKTASPRTHGILFDMPQVIDQAEQEKDQMFGDNNNNNNNNNNNTGNHLSLKERVRMVKGSFFRVDTIPRADVYLLKSIVHDWNDTDAIKILSNIADVSPPGAVVVLGERIIPENVLEANSTLTVNLDVHMMVTLGAKERTVDEFRRLFNAAGWRMHRVLGDGVVPIHAIIGVKQ